MTIAECINLLLSKLNAHPEIKHTHIYGTVTRGTAVISAGEVQLIAFHVSFGRANATEHEHPDLDYQVDPSKLTARIPFRPTAEAERVIDEAAAWMERRDIDCVSAAEIADRDQT